ncbi:hypothetical protein OG520_42665 (plasmid) [Streptomyces sp. NBC_00984]|uniref:hypothetical protein n=1 Tax=Streptomyces sp. NBC_00984 TaxID=2903700 RepID=UPI002F90CAE5|nr:hypothetical protein OG520_42665 [Streptomyces sp. NBC_00984]
MTYASTSADSPSQAATRPLRASGSAWPLSHHPEAAGEARKITKEGDPGTRRVHIEVADGGPAATDGDWAASGSPDEHGRGLEIIDQLTAAYGDRQEPGHAIHWADVNTARLPRPDGSTPSQTTLSGRPTTAAHGSHDSAVDQELRMIAP